MEKATRTNIELGLKIKAARTLQGKTLKELSEACGATPSFLSQVERGIVSPSLCSLRKISESLGAPITDFLDAPGKTRIPPARIKALTRDEKTGSSSEEAVIILEKTSMRPFFIDLEPGGEISGEVLRTGDDMFMLVLEGALEAAFSGAARIYSASGENAEISWKGERILLNEGDSFYSRKSGRPARALNPLARPARLICVTSGSRRTLQD